MASGTIGSAVIGPGLMGRTHVALRGRQRRRGAVQSWCCDRCAIRPVRGLREGGGSGKPQDGARERVFDRATVRCFTEQRSCSRTGRDLYQICKYTTRTGNSRIKGDQGRPASAGGRSPMRCVPADVAG